METIKQSRKDPIRHRTTVLQRRDHAGTCCRMTFFRTQQLTIALRTRWGDPKEVAGNRNGPTPGGRSWFWRAEFGCRSRTCACWRIGGAGSITTERDGYFGGVASWIAGEIHYEKSPSAIAEGLFKKWRYLLSRWWALSSARKA